MTDKKEATAAGPVTFHFSYIVLPAAILILSLALTLFFYRLLPAEVAYRFGFDDSPSGFLGREAAVLLLLGPQLLVVLIAGGITWGVTRLGFLSKYRGSLWFKPERVLALMGNMLAIPQAILCFATLDMFTYNAYHMHIMPLWLFAIIVLIGGTIILGIYSIPLLVQAWKALNSQPNARPRSDNIEPKDANQG